jgi:hypothetical protein
MVTSSNAEIRARRGEILAQMFLGELGAVTLHEPVKTLDFLGIFPGKAGGQVVMAVEIKTRDTEIGDTFPVTDSMRRVAEVSNVPLLLMVIDVRRNTFRFGWLDEFVRASPRGPAKLPLLKQSQLPSEIQRRLPNAEVSTSSSSLAIP